MKAASPILGPLLLTVFLAVVFGMMLHWFEEKGFSTRFALFLILIIFLAIIAIFIVVIAGSLFRMLADIPLYQEKLEGSLGMTGPVLSSIGIDLFSLSGLAPSLSGYAQSIVDSLLDMAIAGAIIILTTIFLLCEAGGFSSKLQQIIGEHRPGDLDRFTLLAQKNVDYIIIRTGVNLAIGVGTVVILWLIGVEYAIFWGFLAFFLVSFPTSVSGLRLFRQCS